MAVARGGKQRREIAGVILRGPHAAFRHFQGREADPLRSRRAMVVPVESGVIHQDGEAAADEHEKEEQIRKVAPADPKRKAMRPGRGAFGGSRGRSKVRQSEDCMLQPRKQERSKHKGEGDQEGSRTQPDAKAAILWIVNSLMCGVERNQWSTSCNACSVSRALRCDQTCMLYTPYQNLISQYDMSKTLQRGPIPCAKHLRRFFAEAPDVPRRSGGRAEDH